MLEGVRPAELYYFLPQSPGIYTLCFCGLSPVELVGKGWPVSCYMCQLGHTELKMEAREKRGSVSVVRLVLEHLAALPPVYPILSRGSIRLLVLYSKVEKP